MKIHFVMASTRFTGGRQEMIRHGVSLFERGHAVIFWVQESTRRLDWINVQVPIRQIPTEGLAQLPLADVCIFDRVRLAAPLLKANRGKVAHLCQGFEGTDLDCKLAERRRKKGFLGSLPGLFSAWKRRREIDRAYALPTAKIATHRPLVELLARRFGQQAWFVPCGLPSGIFLPMAERTFTNRTILVVGPSDTSWKRVPDALQAVGLLKKNDPTIRLVRIAQHPMRDFEKQMGVTDEYHTMLTPVQMAEQYRRADLLVLTSNATEGFGLPALEAMACGLPCVLTDIPAFRAFAATGDHAHFVPVGQPEAQAKAIASLLASPAERARLCRRGIEVAENYRFERSSEAMELALRAIIAGMRTPQAA
jgi:glycosyltransferase involved in cell wall biosynthesis